MTDSALPQILELMASKLCHDIISPVGAVANGVEFLEEMGADAGEDVTNLISFSAGQASAKLQAFRMGYGAGGADSAIKPEDVHKVFESVIAPDGKVRQHWDPYAPIGPESYQFERPAGLSKAIMNVLLLGIECLPKGGDLTLESDEKSITVTAKGENASMSTEAQDALHQSTPYSGLTPKLTHPYLTGLFGQHYSMAITCKSSENHRVTVQISLPPSTI
jgi:histidine phosphotransferase ChpT